MAGAAGPVDRELQKTFPRGECQWKVETLDWFVFFVYFGVVIVSSRHV